MEYRRPAQPPFQVQYLCTANPARPQWRDDPQGYADTIGAAAARAAAIRATGRAVQIVDSDGVIYR